MIPTPILAAGTHARLATLIALTGLFFIAATSAQNPPYASFQYATISGSGNIITISRVPVTTTSGTAYKDVTIQFSVDSSGNLTIASGFPQVASSPSLPLAFTAGIYKAPSSLNNGGVIVVGGPGYTAGGATEWSLSTPPGAGGCTFPNTATWYDGPIAGNPLVARLSHANITSTAWSYGIGSGGCGNVAGAWQGNSLLGFSQVGNTITIVSFTVFGVDSSVPLDSITYTLQQ